MQLALIKTQTWEKHSRVEIPLRSLSARVKRRRGLRDDVKRMIFFKSAICIGGTQQGEREREREKVKAKQRVCVRGYDWTCRKSYQAVSLFSSCLGNRARTWCIVIRIFVFHSVSFITRRAEKRMNKRITSVWIKWRIFTCMKYIAERAEIAKIVTNS